MFKLITIVATICMQAKWVAVNAQGNAPQPVKLSVTLPVTIPFEVPAGVSFSEASAEFANKNGLGQEIAAQLTKALEAKWAEMQAESARVSQQCHTWQRDFGVEPLSSWGTLPQALRREWIELDCDSVVPPNVPKPLVQLSVMIGDKETYLKFYEGDSILGAVKRFCDQNGINMEQNGKMLQETLTAALENLISRTAEPEVNMEKANMPRRGKYLFAVPVSINGEVVRLKVHEGDRLNTLVTNFCQEHGIDVNTYGDALKNEILKTFKDLENTLLAEAEAEAEKKKSDMEQQQSTTETKSKLFSLPVQINGEEASIDIFDGDTLGTKVTEFCAVHGIDEAAYGNTLMEAVMDKVRLLQAQDSSFLRMESAN